jgi:hypothetical protein
MSAIYVNNIQSSTGTTVTIPAGNALSFAGTQLNANTILPPPTGNAGKMIFSNGTSYEFGDYGAVRIVSYTSPNSYVVPNNVSMVHVRLVGAGGGGSGHGESGGSGGYAEGFFTTSTLGGAGTSISVQVGTGGSGTYYSGSSGNGGTTSFGQFLSATGGRGANSVNQHCGGHGGLGSGGSVALYGGGAGGHCTYNHRGGSSYFGGGGAAGHPQGGAYAFNHSQNAAPGGGGAGEHYRSYQGGVGKTGIVIIMEYR